MASVLVKLSDKPGPIESTYRPGDVVSVTPDGFQWGADECPPEFEVLSFPGVDPTSLAFLLQPWLQVSGLPLRYCLWRWDFDAKTFIRKADAQTFHP